MKLLTTIRPRLDGTVIVTTLEKGPKGKPITVTFAPSDDPEADPDQLVGDVDHEPTIKHLLGTGNFEPADEADFEHATELVQSGQSAFRRHLRAHGVQAPGLATGADNSSAGAGEGDGEGEGEGEGGEDDGFTDANTRELVNGGMPQEAATPPSHAKPKKARAAS